MYPNVTAASPRQYVVHAVETLRWTDAHMRPADARTVGASSWLVVVARAWSDGDRRMVRLVARGGDNEVLRVAVESSNRAAAERLLAWLEELAGAHADGAAAGGTSDEPGDERMTPGDTRPT